MRLNYCLTIDERSLGAKIGYSGSDRLTVSDFIILANIEFFRNPMEDNSHDSSHTAINDV